MSVTSHDSLDALSVKLSSVPRIILLSKVLLYLPGCLSIHTYTGVFVSKRRKEHFAQVPMPISWFSASKDAF